MSEIDLKQYAKHLPIVLVVVGTYVAFKLIEPFFSAVILSCIIAYIGYPLYKRIFSIIRIDKLASAITCILIFIIIMIPLIFLSQVILTEASNVYVNTRSSFESGSLLDFSGTKCEERTSLICSTLDKAKVILPADQIEFYVYQLVNDGSQYIIKKVGSIISTVPVIILNIFITIFLVFFLLYQGERTFKGIMRHAPLQPIYKKRINREFHNVIFAVLYGSIITSAVQGFLGGFGFFIFGISQPVLWGIVMGLAAFIPFIGTGLIWFPFSLGLIVTGYLTSDLTYVVRGIGLAIYGIIFISTIDNIIKPKLIGDRAHVHPAVILLGVFGGIFVFGPIGLIVGPLFFSLYISFITLATKKPRTTPITLKPGK